MGVRSLSSPRIRVSASSTVQNLLNDGVTASCTHTNLDFSPTITNGVGANQANRAWQIIDQVMLNGAQEIIDLYDVAARDIGAGAGLDGVGQALVIEEIVGIFILNRNAVTAAGQLEIQPSAAQGWTPIGIHTVANGGALRGGGCLAKVQVAEQGFDVVDGANHRITLRANGGPVTYSVYLLGRHDDEESSSSSSSSISTSSSSISTSSISTSSSSSSSSSLSTSSSSLSSTSSSSRSSISTSSSSTSSSSVSTSSSSTSSTSSSTSSTSSSSKSSSSWSSTSTSESSISTSSSSQSISSISTSSSSTSSSSTSSVSSSSWSSQS